MSNPPNDPMRQLGMEVQEFMNAFMDGDYDSVYRLGKHISKRLNQYADDALKIKAEEAKRRVKPRNTLLPRSLILSKKSHEPIVEPIDISVQKPEDLAPKQDLTPEQIKKLKQLLGQTDDI